MKCSLCLLVLILSFSAQSAPALKEPVPLPKLVERLKSARAEIRREAIDEIGRLGKDAIVAAPVLVRSLNDADTVVRNLAAWALGEIRDSRPETIEALISAFRDQEWTVRHNASVSLTQIGAPAVPFLHTALHAPEPATRVLAAEALALGNTNQIATALPILIGALDSPDFAAQRRAVMAIGKLGPAAQDAAPKMVAALKEADERTRSQTIQVLGALGPSAAPALPELIRIFKEEKDAALRRSALTAAVKIGAGREELIALLLEHLGETNERMASAVITAFDQMGDAIIPRLAQALRSEVVPVRVNALNVLQRFGPRAAPAIPALVTALSDPELSVRSRAAFVLGLVGRHDAMILPALEQAARDTNEIVRVNASLALQRLQASASPRP